MDIKPGRWRHFKGGEYEVIGTAAHSETLEPMVVYRALYGEGGLWVRPAAMWTEPVEREGYSGPRFRYVGFKERRIKFQAVDLKKQGMSLGELSSVKNAVGLEAMVDPRHPDAVLVSYLAGDQARLEKLFEDPTLLRTPVVRNGRQATVGFCPEVWEGWE